MEAKTKSLLLGIGAVILIGGALVLINRKLNDSNKSSVLGIKGRGLRGRGRVRGRRGVPPVMGQAKSCSEACLIPYPKDSKHYGYFYCNKACTSAVFH